AFIAAIADAYRHQGGRNTKFPRDGNQRRSRQRQQDGFALARLSHDGLERLFEFLGEFPPVLHETKNQSLRAALPRKRGENLQRLIFMDGNQAALTPWRLD